MKTQGLQRFRLFFRLNSQITALRAMVQSSTLEETHIHREENWQPLFTNLAALLETLQALLCPDGRLPEVPDYEDLAPDEVDLSLAQLVVIFRQTLQQLQAAPPERQHNALDILQIYFMELQGLYDLVSVRKFTTQPPVLPLSLSALEEHHKRYFRCFKISAQALAKMKSGGLSEDVLQKIASLQEERLLTEEQLLKKLTDVLGKRPCEQHKFLILKHAQYLLTDSVLQKYKTIKYQDIMSVSAWHHARVVLGLFPQYCITAIRERIQRVPRCARIQNPETMTTCEALHAFLAQHPLTETTKLSIAIHRHIMRFFDLVGTRLVLKLGRTMFEVLLLATWFQTMKDHVLAGHHTAQWQAAPLDLIQDREQEVLDADGATGKIRLSSALFMQPRVKFGFERFLIFKLRTMTVGETVRVTELGEWMRKNSPDEFFQFFNVALGDMGGLGVRTMPEHEILETEDTLWLYTALTSFVPGGITSPGSIVMRKEDYGLTKEEQLFQEILYYDPRFKGSSGLWTDISTAFKSLRVLNKGRGTKTLRTTESFNGKKRGI